MTTAERVEAPFRIVDGFKGWYRLPSDPPNGYRGANDRQREVLRLIREAEPGSTTIIFYGGAAGGGKTNLHGNLALKVAEECPGASVLVTRHKFVHLKATTLIEFDGCIPPQFEFKKYDSSPVYREVRRDPSKPWSRVWFRPMDDWQSLMSAEYGVVLIEEGQETDERGMLALLTRMRHQPETKWVIVVCFNPFPSWCTEWAMDGQLPAEINSDPNLHVYYVRSLMDDNPYLRPGYKQMLMATLDDYMKAVLIEGRAEAVPNAVYGDLMKPELEALFQVRDKEVLERARLLYGMTGWDWGTSEVHKSAGALGAIDKEGVLWTLDAWESSLGSSNELEQNGNYWQDTYGVTKEHKTGFRIGARYDASQGSLRDPLIKIFGELNVDKGVRDVDGRIREGRGLVATKRLRFNMLSPGVRQLWRYLTLYHRDDDGDIVEEKDDMVDAWHYMLYGLVGNRRPVDTRLVAGVTTLRTGGQAPPGASRLEQERARRRNTSQRPPSGNDWRA